MSTKLVTCEACQNQVSMDAAKCPQCGHPVKKKYGCLHYGCASVGALILVFFLIAIVGNLTAPNPGPGQNQYRKRYIDDHRSVVISYFVDQKLALNGSDKFCNPGEAVTMFSVKDYDFINEVEHENGSKFVVRVNSSTKGGLPITKDWVVIVTGKPGKWCISGVHDKAIWDAAQKK